MTASGERTAGAVASGSKPPLAVPRRLLKLRSDAALAERFALGDEAAFDVLYERYRPAVLSVCMGILPGAHDAEDVTQETFSALAIALHETPPQEMRPWLARVARNRAIDVTRRGRQRALTRDGELPEVAAQQHGGKAELAVVFEGIRELPESQRTALLMRELGGHSYTEIAALLETHEDAVRGLIARARVGLRSYREAAQLPCAAARASIEAEPDGRRHDRAVRRHLRTCASCRAYRAALRDDVRALRAILPIEGGIGGGMLGGGLAAGKGMLVGAGLTQASAACAASVCAAGAVGGIVLIAPLHQVVAPMPAIATHRHSHQVQPLAKPVQAPRSVYSTAPRNVATNASAPQHAATGNAPATYTIHFPSARRQLGAGSAQGVSSRAVGSHRQVGLRGHANRPAAIRSAQQSHPLRRQAGPMQHEALPNSHQGGPAQSGAPHQQGGQTTAGTSRQLHAPVAQAAPTQVPAPTSMPTQAPAGASTRDGAGDHPGRTADHGSSAHHSGLTTAAGSDQGNGSIGSNQAANGDGAASGHGRSTSGQVGVTGGNPHTAATSDSQGSQNSTAGGSSVHGSSTSADGSDATQGNTGRSHADRSPRSARRASATTTDVTDLAGQAGSGKGSSGAQNSHGAAGSSGAGGSDNGGGASKTDSAALQDNGGQSGSVTGTDTTPLTSGESQADGGSPTDTSSAQPGTTSESSPPTTTTDSQTTSTSPNG